MEKAALSEQNTKVHKKLYPSMRFAEIQCSNFLVMYSKMTEIITLPCWIIFTIFEYYFF